MAHSVDLGYRILASRYLRRQTKQLAEQLDGMLIAEDIEYVHRARVSTRRLRSALRLFDDCFPARRIKRWRKAIRRIAKELGQARDRDVQIDYLCNVLAAATGKGCFPGIARLLVRLERQRERLQGRVIEAVRRLESAEVLREIQQAVKRVLAAETTSVSIHPSAYRRFEQHIVRRWEELCQQQACLQNPADHHGHHVMRIAAKRLRYTVEIARSAFSGQIDEAVNASKQVQTLLGEVHDCDVWLANLDEFAADERRRIVSMFGHAGPFSRLQEGIDYLRQERQMHRTHVFNELVAYWEQLQRNGFGDRLLAVIRRETTSPTSSNPTVPQEGRREDNQPVEWTTPDAGNAVQVSSPNVEANRDANGDNHRQPSEMDGATDKPALAPP
jgi:CHAD domain-containing protein